MPVRLTVAYSIGAEEGAKVGVATDALPPVQRHQFKTADPEHAYVFISQSYRDYTVRFSLTGSCSPQTPAGVTP